MMDFGRFRGLVRESLFSGILILASNLRCVVLGVLLALNHTMPR